MFKDLEHECLKILKLSRSPNWMRARARSRVRKACRAGGPSAGSASRKKDFRFPTKGAAGAPRLKRGSTSCSRRTNQNRARTGARTAPGPRAHAQKKKTNPNAPERYMLSMSCPPQAGLIVLRRSASLRFHFVRGAAKDFY